MPKSSRPPITQLDRQINDILQTGFAIGRSPSRLLLPTWWKAILNFTDKNLAEQRYESDFGSIPVVWTDNTFSINWAS